MEERFDVVYKPAGSDAEVPMVCGNVNDFLKIIQMHEKKIIQVISVNGMPIVNVSKVEIDKEDCR